MKVTTLINFAALALAAPHPESAPEPAPGTLVYAERSENVVFTVPIPPSLPFISLLPLPLSPFPSTTTTQHHTNHAAMCLQELMFDVLRIDTLHLMKGPIRTRETRLRALRGLLLQPRGL
jgi:hypothetical protein